MRNIYDESDAISLLPVLHEIHNRTKEYFEHKVIKMKTPTMTRKTNIVFCKASTTGKTRKGLIHEISSK